MEGYPFAHEETVRFNELDSMGHVNNAVFLTYLEQARLAWFGPVAEGEAMQLDDVILARTFELEYELRVGDRLVAEARSVIVGFDYDAGRSTEVPERWRTRLESAAAAGAGSLL